MNWHLEDSRGVLYKAEFVEILHPADTKGMKWDRRIFWAGELASAKMDGRRVFKLIDSATHTAQGGISMSDEGDHVYVHLIESASHNRADPRIYVNVARLLISYAGQRSIDIGADGYLALTPKTALIDYYAKQFRAYPLPGGKMGIHGHVIKILISVYYKERM